VIGEAEVASALREAQAVADHTSRCLRKKVGAILFSSNGRFLSYGANINPPGQPCDEGFCPRGQKTFEEQPVNAPYDDCTATHAEMVALALGRERLGARPHDLLSSLKALGQLRGGAIVVTHEPCHECKPTLKTLGLNVYWPEGRVLAS
jgi:deoxycytidylate deaminase